MAAAEAEKTAAALKDTSSVAATTSSTVVVEAKSEKVDPSKVARTSSTATSISRGREGVTTSTATTTTSSSRIGVVSAAMPSSTASALQAAALANSGSSSTHTITHRDLSYTVNDKVEKLESKLVKVVKEGKTETAEKIAAKIEKYEQDPTYVDPATVIAIASTSSAGPSATATGEKPAKEAVDPQEAKTDKTVAVPAETLTEIPSVPVADGHHAASEERTEGPKGMNKLTEQNAKLGVAFAAADEVATTTETTIAATTETMEEAVPVPTVVRKLSSKKGKDSRPTMTPRTDKPSDRVTRRLSSSESKEEKLEAKLAKAEKKGDEKLEAKLEKKIEKLSTATEEVAVVEEVAATEPMQAVAPVEAWVEDVVDNTAITTTAPVVATPATPATPTTTDVPSKNAGDVATREAGPKGAAKKLAHDGSPETTTTATTVAATTETMEEAVPVPTVVRQLSKKSKAKKAAKKSLSISDSTTTSSSTMATSFLSVSPVLNLLEALPSKADKAEKKTTSSSKTGDGPSSSSSSSSSSDTETGAGTGPTASVRESQKEAAVASAEKEAKTGEPKIADPPKEEEVKEEKVVEEEEEEVWVAKEDPGNGHHLLPCKALLLFNKSSLSPINVSFDTPMLTLFIPIFNQQHIILNPQDPSLSRNQVC